MILGTLPYTHKLCHSEDDSDSNLLSQGFAASQRVHPKGTGRFDINIICQCHGQMTLSMRPAWTARFYTTVNDVLRDCRMHQAPKDAVHTVRLATHNHIVEKQLGPGFEETYKMWVGGKGTGQSIMCLGWHCKIPSAIVARKQLVRQGIWHLKKFSLVVFSGTASLRFRSTQIHILRVLFLEVPNFRSVCNNIINVNIIINKS